MTTPATGSMTKLATGSMTKLATGSTMPTVGVGFWKVAPEDAAGLVRTAVDIGYRHFDCACDYGNESQVGDGLRQVLRGSHNPGGLSRDEVWITSKLWNTYHRPEHVRAACERTLSDLGLDELDLYLIHFPIALKFVPFEDRYPPEWFHDPDAAEPRMEYDPVRLTDTWGAMEDLVDAGLVREIGVSNYNIALIRETLAGCRIRPSLLQVELHPYLTQDVLLRYCAQEQIAVTAFSPLGGGSYVSIDMATPDESVLTDPVVTAIANRLGRSPAQVVLRWGVQRGTSVIPKSLNPDHLRDNLALFDFELTAEDMAAVTSLNRNRRFNDPTYFCENVFNTLFPIFE